MSDQLPDIASIPTPPPSSGRSITGRFNPLNGVNKYLLALIIGLLTGGGGGAAWLMGGSSKQETGLEKQVRELEEKLDEQKELRLGGIEGRLSKIEKVQLRHGRVLDRIAGKLRVKDSGDDE